MGLVVKFFKRLAGVVYTLAIAVKMFGISLKGRSGAWGWSRTSKETETCTHNHLSVLFVFFSWPLSFGSIPPSPMSVSSVIVTLGGGWFIAVLWVGRRKRSVVSSYFLFGT